MKKFPVYLCALTLFVCFFTSCTGDEKSDTTGEAAESMETPAVEEDVQTRSLGTGNSQEISSTEACNRINAFKDRPDSDEIPCYYTLSSADVNALINDLDGTDSIFAMYGYNEGLSTNRNIEKYDLIFCIRESEGSAFKYFDFTKPCPAYCPTFVQYSCGTPPAKSELDGNLGYWMKRGGLTGTLNHDSVIMRLDPENTGGNIMMMGCNDPDGCDDGGWSLEPCGGESGTGMSCSEICQ